jgi:hypothetical protein
MAMQPSLRQHHGSPYGKIGAILGDRLITVAGRQTRSELGGKFSERLSQQEHVTAPIDQPGV